MPRKLRMVFENAIYHVINRGNYRREVFGSEGAAKSFEETLFEVVERYGWELHGYVIMSNHYHLAVTTPQPNLIEGMQWLQATYAARFNRFRSVQGHLFQGRYKAQIVEPGESLARVVNYIHLNPVRAKLVEPTQVAQFRWSSLRRYVQTGNRRPGMEALRWLSPLGLKDERKDWNNYVTWLVNLGGDEAALKKEGLAELGPGWALGTLGWRRALAKEYAQFALIPDLEKAQVRELLETHSRTRLGEELAKRGKSVDDLAKERKGALWKIEIARILRQEGLATNTWVAKELSMGHPRAVSSYLSKRKNMSYEA